MSGRTDDDAAADAWLQFLDDAIGGLRRAALEINAPGRKADFEARDGWFGKANRTAGGSRLPDETSISQALIEVMDESRALQYVTSPVIDPGMPDLTRMEFHIEVPRRYDGRIGPRAQPTDIQFAMHREGIDLRIEAKKVTVERDIARHYLGAEGLGRFDDVTAPYTLERFGGMAAYVTDRDATAWGHSIADRVGGAATPGSVTATTVAGVDLLTTTHIRDIDLPNFKVKGRFRTDVVHFVLEFDASPSRRPCATPKTRKGRSKAAASKVDAIPPDVT